MTIYLHPCAESYVFNCFYTIIQLVSACQLDASESHSIHLLYIQIITLPETDSKKSEIQWLKDSRILFRMSIVRDKIAVSFHGIAKHLHAFFRFSTVAEFSQLPNPLCGDRQ